MPDDAARQSREYIKQIKRDQLFSRSLFIFQCSRGIRISPLKKQSASCVRGDGGKPVRDDR